MHVPGVPLLAALVVAASTDDEENPSPLEDIFSTTQTSLAGAKSSAVDFVQESAAGDEASAPPPAITSHSPVRGAGVASPKAVSPTRAAAVSATAGGAHDRFADLRKR